MMDRVGIRIKCLYFLLNLLCRLCLLAVEKTALGQRLLPFMLPAHASFEASFKMEDVEMYSDHLLFNKRQLGPIGQYTV